MSGYLRCGFAVLFLAAGFATPAAANALTDLFTPNTASEAATAAPAAPAPEPCARQPGPPAAGQHWFYRLEGSRKCWYQAAEDSATAKRAARHYVASRRVAAPEESEPAPRKQKAVEDARAELVNAAPAQTQESAPVPAPAPAQAAMPQPTPSAPKITMLRTVPVRVAEAAAQVPPASVAATPGVDRPVSEQPVRPQIDVDRLLTEASAASDEVASAPPATPLLPPGANTSNGEDWMASWLGVLLMALGCVAVLSASGTLRRAVWPVRSPNSVTELPVIAQGGRNEPSFGRSAAPLVHAARTHGTVAAGLPSQEAFWEEGIGALAALTSPVSPVKGR
jgi:hypothetical protein